MATEHNLKTAYAYLYIRDFEAARRAFEQAILEDPENPETYFHASVTALRNGELQYAEDAARKAISLAPESALYNAHLGAVLAKRYVRDAKEALSDGRITQGRELLEYAVEADPLCDIAQKLLDQLESPSEAREEL